MTENNAHKDALSLALHEGLERYLARRREKIAEVLDETLTLKRCFLLQARHLPKDVLCNPLNTFWAFPYLTLKKFLELFEKLGLEFPKTLLPAIPQSARTEFQKEVERLLQTELFGLPTDRSRRSELAETLECHDKYRDLYGTREWSELVAGAEGEIRKQVTAFCDARNGFNDLASAGALAAAAQYFFGDRSLDVFMMGRRWAATWAHDRAVSHFFLGRKLGRTFYSVVHPPAPTTKEIWVATGIALALVAAFSTVVNVVSYPLQNRIGVQARQLDRLLKQVEEKLLLQLAKNLRGR